MTSMQLVQSERYCDVDAHFCCQSVNTETNGEKDAGKKPPKQRSLRRQNLNKFVAAFVVLIVFDLLFKLTVHALSEESQQLAAYSTQ